MGTLWLKPKSERALSLVIGRPDAPSIEAVTGELWVGYANEEIGRAQFLGYVAPGTTGKFEFNPVKDSDIRLYLVTRTEDGGAESVSLLDAEQKVIQINRETVAPVLTQSANATNTVVRIGVQAFSRFARRRKVEVSDNSDMSGATVTIYESSDYQAKILPDYVDITRAAASGTLTKYVRVSHAAGDNFGPVSNILSITFADSGGGGGSGGDPTFIPGGRDEYQIV